MKKNDLGFVLQRTSYSETSSIVKVYTQEHGLKSFMLQGGNKKYSAVLQIFTPIEFTFYQKKDELAKMYEPSVLFPLNNIQFDVLKNSYLFFQSEIILRSIREEQKDTELFGFLFRELSWLNENEHAANFLLYWMLELSGILGFSPHVLDNSATDFDLLHGEISANIDLHSQVISNPLIGKLILLLNGTKEENLALKLPKEERKFLLNLLLDYYKTHLSNFHAPKSLEVYQTIWYD